MKKNYFLALLLLANTILSFGQELLINGDFESWDDSSTPTSWSKIESTTQESTEVNNGSYSLKHTGGTSDIGQTVSGIIAGNSYTVTVWYKVDSNFGDETDARIWSYWKDASGSSITDENTDANLRGPDNGYFDNNGNIWTKYTATVVAPTDASQFYFELRTYGSAVVYYDNLSFFAEEAIATIAPSLTITSPSNNTEFTPGTTEVIVSYTSENFEISASSGYIKQTIASNSDSMYDSAQLFEANDNINFAGLPDGRTMTITLELLDKDGNSLEPAVSDSVTFSIGTITTVSNLAALRSSTEGLYYEVTGEVVLTYDTANSRNQKYLLDSNGEAAILIDDSNGVITTSYNVGDGITGLKGMLSSYNGVFQFTPSEDPGISTSSNNPIPYLEVTSLTDLVNNPDTYESKPITISDIEFAEANEVDEFAYGNFTISKNEETATFRVQFTEEEFVGQVIPSGNQNITGIGSEFSGAGQIYGLSVLSLATASVDNNMIDGFATYPNPITDNYFNISSTSINEKQVHVFNVLGKKVLSTKVTGLNTSINVSSLVSGMYILKVTEGSKIATKKLLIK